MNQPTPLARYLSAFGPFIALILLVFGMCVVVGPHFHSYINVCIVLTQTSNVAIAACGMTLIIVSGGIDLSVGSAIALTGVVSALVIDAGYSPLVAVIAGVATGGLVGLINGLIISLGGMAPFIVTLGMLGIARGTAKKLSDSQTVDIPKSWISTLMQPYPQDSDSALMHWMMVAPAVWIALLIALGMALLTRRTVFGRHVYALGSNEAGARLCGIRVRSTKVIIYVISGILIGVTGILNMSNLAAGDPTTAAGRELDVIAAVVIGGASLNGGTGGILGTMIGSLIMAVLRNGLQQMGKSTADQEIIIGVVIIVAVFVDKLRTKRAT